jgi:hypothetical protein
LGKPVLLLVLRRRCPPRPKQHVPKARPAGQMLNLAVPNIPVVPKAKSPTVQAEIKKALDALAPQRNHFVAAANTLKMAANAQRALRKKDEERNKELNKKGAEIAGLRRHLMNASAVKRPRPADVNRHIRGISSRPASNMNAPNRSAAQAVSEPRPASSHREKPKKKARANLKAQARAMPAVLVISG